ncbi:MAG: hypothetical protein ACREVW_04255 [Burkholderiales bacterium]
MTVLTHDTTELILPGATADDAARKAHSTLEAHAALAGHHCFKTEDGTILLSRWGRVAEFETVAKAADWLARVTGGES